MVIHLDQHGVVGLAVDHGSTGALIRGDVQVHVGEAHHVAPTVGPAERPADRAHVGLGEGSAAARPDG
jgi:hypothetical protein